MPRSARKKKEQRKEFKSRFLLYDIVATAALQASVYREQMTSRTLKIIPRDSLQLHEYRAKFRGHTDQPSKKSFDFEIWTVYVGLIGVT